MFVVIDSGCAQFCLMGEVLEIFQLWGTIGIIKMFFFPNIKENYSRIVYACLSLLTLVVHNFVWRAIGRVCLVSFEPLLSFGPLLCKGP